MDGSENTVLSENIRNRGGINTICTQVKNNSTQNGAHFGKKQWPRIGVYDSQRMELGIGIKGNK